MARPQDHSGLLNRPVRVIGLTVVLLAGAGCDVRRTAVPVSGTVTLDGQPLEGAGLRIFLDGDDLFRGQGYSTAPPTGKSGAFRIDLLP